MYEIKEIYEFYKKAEAKKKGKQYKRTKNFETRFIEVFIGKTQDLFIEITDKFNEEWEKVDPEKYFNIAFKVIKGMKYGEMLNPKIIEKYVSNEVKERKKHNKSIKAFFSLNEVKIEEVIEIPKEKKKVYTNIEGIKEIYIEYRKAQAFVNNRGYRIPKDFEKHFNTKMNERAREALDTAYKNFLTKWRNVDPYQYFLCGFELYKGFSYHQFQDKKIMSLFVRKDKNRKMKNKNIAKEFEKSKLFVLDYMKKNKIKSLKAYCDLRNGNESIVSQHYTRNFLCQEFVVKLISKGLVILNDTDRNMMPMIVNNYREILQSLKELKENE